MRRKDERVQLGSILTVISFKKVIKLEEEVFLNQRQTDA